MKSLCPFLLILLLISSCKKEDENTWEADPAGQWYMGDMHVHTTGASNDTGGDSYPEDVKRVAIERGLSFVVLTDHSNSTGSDATTTDEDSLLFNQGPEFPYWDSAAFYTDNSFLMIDGNEISPVNPDNNIPTGHIGCIPMDLSTFNKDYVFTDRPKGTVNGESAMSQATAAGCFKILNHPYALTRWIAYDWSSTDYDAMEIWNGTIGFDPWDEYAYHAWICDLLAGKQVTPIGSSDCHRVNTITPGKGLDPALGYPVTAVFAQNLTWNNIMQGLKNGEVSLFEGESRLFIDDYTEEKRHANGNNIYWIRLRGKADAKLETPVLKLHLYTSCTDILPRNIDNHPLAADTVLHEVAITPGESFDIAVKVTGGTGVYNATLRGTGFHYCAISKAIVVK